MIQSEGAEAGVVINPSTPVWTLEEILEVADYVLVMSVNPGFGGQQFIPRSLNKVRALDRMRRERGLKFKIEIDGGVSLHNLADVVRAGVDWVVAGSSVFHSPDPSQTVAQMMKTARDATAVRV
jgi:ribulose-phosphate 3-epimerase